MVKSYVFQVQHHRGVEYMVFMGESYASVVGLGRIYFAVSVL